MGEAAAGGTRVDFLEEEDFGGLLGVGSISAKFVAMVVVLFDWGEEVEVGNGWKGGLSVMSWSCKVESLARGFFQNMEWYLSR